MPRPSHRSNAVQSVAALAVLLLAGCRRAAEPLSLSGFSMGTYWTAVVNPAPGETRAQIQGLIQRELDRVDAALSTWRNDSDLSRLRDARPDQRVAAAPATVEVLRLADSVVRSSRGAFDPTIGPLVQLWGFGPGSPDHSEDNLGAASSPEWNREAPSMEAIEAARARVDWDAVEIGEDWISRSRDDVEVDASGIAKGFAVDRVASALLESGHAAFLIEVGGEVVVRGTNADGDPWVLGIDHPAPARNSEGESGDRGLAAPRISARLALSKGAIATSGDYRNTHLAGTHRVSHIIDPRTGKPVEHGLVSATVLAPTCGLADALATAVMVLGPEAGLDYLERLDDVEGYLLVQAASHGAALQVLMTTGMAAYLLEPN